MAQLPKPGDTDNNLLWKITENTFGGGLGGGGAVGTVIVGSTPDRVLQTGPLGQLESGAVTTTELGFLSGATSNLQVQIDAFTGGIVGIESLADATAMWITADETIGIGTSSPDALLDVQSRTPLSGTGTISSSGATVTGVGTVFLTQLRVGDTLIVGTQRVLITSISSNTSLVTITSFVPNLPASTAFTYQLAIQRWSDESGALLGIVDARGRVFIGDVLQSDALLSLSYTATNPFSTTRGLATNMIGVATTATSTRAIIGWQAAAFIGGANTQNWTSAVAILGLDMAAGTFAPAVGTIANVIAGRFSLLNTSAGTVITNGYLIQEAASAQIGGYTNLVGIALLNHTVATNNTNLLIGPTTAPAGNWSIYNSSAHVNYFEGSLGLGTTTPDGKLHVFTGSGGTITPQTFADELVLESNGNVGMSLLSPNTAVASICFGDPEDNDAGSFNYNHVVDVLSAQVGGVEFLYLMSTKRVGIGISTPDGTLHVMTSSIGAATADPNADDLVVENNGPCGISILSINNDQAVLSFGDVDDQDIGQIVYENNGDSMLFICNTFNTMTIVASQRVGIKTNAPDGTLHVLTESAGTVTASATADDLTLENNDHCGISILCPADKVGVIFFGDPDDNDIGQISYNHAVNTLTFTVGTVNVADVIATAFKPTTNDLVSLGTSGQRWTEVFATAGAINTSDAREKHDIEGIGGEFAHDLVDKITPRSYVWNSESQRGTHYGFVAQEIEAVIARWGLSANEFAPLHYDQENDRYGLREAELLPFLWRVVQDLSARVKALET